MILASCTKEGPAGLAGKDGSDGTSECITCHDDSQQIFEKSNQWASSGHAMNGNFERNGKVVYSRVAENSEDSFPVYAKRIIGKK